MTTVSRFPRPEFDTAYQSPLTAVDFGRAYTWEFVDIAMLFVFLVLASLFALRYKSRTGLIGLSIASIAYFGFFRKGCVCPIGAIQSVSVSLLGGELTVSYVIIAFFTLPLIFAFWFGRVFCSSVCPFGALQEIVQYKPIKLPKSLTAVLGIIPYAYLSLSILFAATGTTFLICKYDPFIAIFRMSGSFDFVLYSIAFLLLSIVVARPYCRFLCPYGVLLKWATFFAKYNIENTSGDCVGCRLCEDACTIDVIRGPNTDDYPDNLQKGIRRLFLLVLALPLFAFSGGWLVSHLDSLLSMNHPTVALAHELAEAHDNEAMEWELEAWRSSGQSHDDLILEAEKIQSQFRHGGWYAGGFIGLVFGSSLIQMSRWKQRKCHTTDAPSCVSCGRCFVQCPLKKLKPEQNFEKIGKNEF